MLLWKQKLFDGMEGQIESMIWIQYEIFMFLIKGLCREIGFWIKQQVHECKMLISVY